MSLPGSTWPARKLGPLEEHKQGSKKMPEPGTLRAWWGLWGLACQESEQKDGKQEHNTWEHLSFVSGSADSAQKAPVGELCCQTSAWAQLSADGYGELPQAGRVPVNWPGPGLGAAESGQLLR